MTPRNFVYLAIAAALSVLFGVVSYASNNQWSTGRSAGDKLFPALFSQASQVATVEVRQGENAIVLERTGGSWGLKTRGDYPADPAKVRALMVGLAEADLIEPKTRRPDRYAVLQLEDPADRDAKSLLVRLVGAKGDIIGEVVVGKKRHDMLGTGKDGTYVRKPGDPQTWLADVKLEASVAARDWLKTSILTTDVAKISRIVIEIPGEEPLQIERQPAPAKNDKDAKEASGPAAKLQFAGFPPSDKKLKDAGAAEGIARALASIDMEDVRKAEAPQAGAAASTVTLASADGPTVAMRLRKDGDAHWLSISATGDGEAKTAADEINRRTQGWEFKIPAYKADSILKKRGDLLEAAS